MVAPTVHCSGFLIDRYFLDTLSAVRFPEDQTALLEIQAFGSGSGFVFVVYYPAEIMSQARPVYKDIRYPFVLRKGWR